jgi:hypothetical protein
MDDLQALDLEESRGELHADHRLQRQHRLRAASILPNAAFGMKATSEGRI